jgi:Ca2+-binding EF-hand superfamily protein
MMEKINPKYHASGSSQYAIAVDKIRLGPLFLVSYYERNGFASSSPENMRILNAFEVICVLCNGADLLDGMMLASQTPKAKDQALALGLKTLFDQFDVDGSGAIDRGELQRLMIDLPGRYYVSPEDVCLPGDVALVMKTLDADGSGTVDFEEWKNWVLTGVKKSPASRAKFSAQSPGHLRLDRFMDTIMHISHELSAPLLDNETETVPGLTALFEEYNVAHDGKMVPKELKAMVVELRLKYKEVQWFDVNDNTAAAIVLAVGGGGLRISLENWIQWMVRGARRPALKRARFSSASNQFKVLNTFLEGVLRVVRIRTLKALSASSHVPEYRRGCGRHTSGYAGTVGKVL